MEHEAELEEGQLEDNGGHRTMINHEDGDGDLLNRTNFSKYTNHVMLKGLKNPAQRLMIINMLKDDESKEEFINWSYVDEVEHFILEFCYCKSSSSKGIGSRGVVIRTVLKCAFLDYLEIKVLET